MNQSTNIADILIVDDTPQNLQILSATLLERGYKVRGATRGSMAIRIARSVIPDLILLDIKMPEQDGYQVCQQLKADIITRDIPIIFLSALDETMDKVLAFKMGGVDYITKPFQVEEVLARVENQLTIRRLQKKLSEQNQQLQQEVAERKKAQEAAQAAAQAKTEFLTNMSHELRTPLNIILGFTEVMKRDSYLNEQQKENLRIISSSGEHLLDLINDILDLSKIEAGVSQLELTNFDLYYLLDSLEEMFILPTEKKKLKLIIEIHKNVPQFIKTDAKKIRSCLINLLHNAIKFTQLGQVTLTVQQLSDNPFNLQFQVADTGCGISNEEISQLFQAFSQAKAGREAVEGTGLGLVITRQFIRMMGGDIFVQSQLGQGTTFTFNILAEPATCSIIETPSRKVIGLVPNQPTYRVLVVDDTKYNRLLLQRLLQPIGFEVIEAENGQQAIVHWENQSPDLILIDTRMPIMDGIETTRIIRNKEASLQRSRTIIIALTASNFEEKRSSLLLIGCDDFIHKPFTETIIFEKLAQHLKIEYTYKIESSLKLHDTFTANTEESSMFQNLRSLNTSYLNQLYEAANQVDEDTTLDLIEQIKSDYPQLYKGLKTLYDQARFDKIILLIQKVSE